MRNYLKKAIKALVTANGNLKNAQKYHTKYTENPMISSSNVNDSVNFVKDNIKNSIDLNSENSTKDFTITPSSSRKCYKNSNIFYFCFVVDFRNQIKC